MNTLNLSAIRTDGGTQTRKELNTQIVEEYAELMKEGHQFPSMIVYHDGSDYWLSSGFHRYFANKKNGTQTVNVDIRQGTKRDALLYSFGSNKGNGLRPNYADIRYAIGLMLNDPEWSKYTNTVIANILGVSSMTVGRVKAAMIQANTLKESMAEKIYTTEKGEKKVNTEKLAKKKTEQPVQAPVEQPVYDEKEDRVKELSVTIQSLDDENKRLKDIIATKRWDASEIEQEDVFDTINELRETIRILEMENQTLRDSRDMYQARNAELIRQLKSKKK